MAADQTIQQALRVKRAVKDYFDKNPSVSEIPAKDLMPWFINKGIFEKDHRNGLPIRNLLRALDQNNLLHLIPYTRVERKEVNRNWFFQRLSGVNGAEEELIEQTTTTETQLESEGRKERKNNDETYVIDLCDEVLKQVALRQHKFDFLRGDPGKNGEGAKLPVDAYYPELNLVIEYREKQHTESVPIMDQRMTVSGITRGEQRKRYDERRRKVLPEHGIQLIEISYSDFKFDSKKRIIRLEADRDKVESLINKHIK